VLPPRDNEAVYDSLMGQSARHVHGVVPSEEQQQKLLSLCMDRYPHTTPNQILSSMDLPLLREQIRNILTHDIVQDANPGFPLASLFSENQAVLKALGMEFIIDVTIGRIMLLLTTDCSKLTPAELVRLGLCDTIRAFVKNEAHPPRKQTTLRWRVISSVSLIDQTIDRLLHTTQNKVEIALWRYIPSAPGIGLSTDEDGANLVKKIDRMSSNKPVALSDVSGFDWSVQEWEILLDAKARCMLQDANPVITKLIMNRAHSICRSVWATPDGTMYAQLIRGVVKSGTFNTSSTNSRIRVILAWLIGAAWALAMGDDCIEEPVDGASEMYAKYGHPLKMYEVREEKGIIEFCSHDFNRSTGEYIPVDPTKSLYTLLAKAKNGKLDPQALSSFLHHVRHHPSKQEYIRAIMKMTDEESALQMLADATR